MGELAQSLQCSSPASVVAGRRRMGIAALVASGLVALLLFTDAPAGIIFATKSWDASANWAPDALPLFIWMGEILYRTRLAEDMFSGLGPWVRRLPGRLVHVNVLGCRIFAAVSGSSAATAATIVHLAAGAQGSRL